MEAYVKWVFDNQQTRTKSGKDGIKDTKNWVTSQSISEELQAEFERDTGQKAGSAKMRDPYPELNGVDSMVVEDFFNLASSRSSNGFGSNPIPYVEILSYILLGEPVWVTGSVHEFVKAIKHLDAFQLELIAEKSEKDRAKNEIKKNSTKHRR